MEKATAAVHNPRLPASLLSLVVLVCLLGLFSKQSALCLSAAVSDSLNEPAPVVLNDVAYDALFLETPIAGYDPAMMTGFGFYHSGVGYRGVNTGQEVVIELRVTGPSVIDTMVPKIDLATMTMQWDNGQKIWWINRADAGGHWGNLTHETYLTTVSKEQVEAIACWADLWANEHAEYVLFNVVPQKDPLAQKAFLKSITCYDFAWLAIGHLYDMGAQWKNESAVLHREIINFVVDQAPVSTADQLSAAKFYILMGETFKDLSHNLTWSKFRQILKMIEQQWDGFFFHGEHDSYWMLDLALPVLDLPVYKEYPLPSGDRQPQTLPPQCWPHSVRPSQSLPHGK